METNIISPPMDDVFIISAVCRVLHKNGTFVSTDYLPTFPGFTLTHFLVFGFLILFAIIIIVFVSFLWICTVCGSTTSPSRASYSGGLFWMMVGTFGMTIYILLQTFFNFYLLEVPILLFSIFSFSNGYLFQKASYLKSPQPLVYFNIPTIIASFSLFIGSILLFPTQRDPNCTLILFIRIVLSCIAFVAFCNWTVLLKKRRWWINNKLVHYEIVEESQVVGIYRQVPYKRKTRWEWEWNEKASSEVRRWRKWKERKSKQPTTTYIHYYLKKGDKIEDFL